MKKKILLIIPILVMFAIGSVFAAVPNTDYSKAGKGAISLEAMYLDTSMTNVAGNDSMGKKWNFGIGGEVVVAPKWAIGLKYSNVKGDEYGYDGVYKYSNNVKLKSFDLTVQYMAYQKDGFSIIPYLGWARDKTKTEGIIYVYNFDASSDTKNSILFGSKLVYDCSKKVTVYGDVGVGSDIFKWGVGAAYKFTPNVALSVGYDYRKVDDLKFYALNQHAKSYHKVNGLNIGVSYIF